MKSEKELRELRAPLAKTIREMADKANNENREFTAEEKENWEKVNKDYDDFSRQIDLAARAERVQADQESRADTKPLPGRDDVNHAPENRRDEDAPKQPSEDDRAMALQAWCRHQLDLDLEERHLEACKRVGMNPAKKTLNINLPDTSTVRALQNRAREVHPSQLQRALSSVSLGAGAAAIPQGFMSSLEIAMLQFGGIRQAAEILRTTSGEEMPWPTANDTGNRGRRIAENTAVDTTGAAAPTGTPNPTFGRVTWFAYKYTSDAVLVPTELLEDSAFDLPQLLGQMLGERLGRITNYENTVGTGASQPKGIVTAATLGITAASATAITADEVRRLVHSVDPAYRTNAGFMLHDATLLALRLLKTGDGQYLWQSGMSAGVPDRLEGYPIIVNQDMASSVAASAKTILFGQLSKYKVREVRGIRLYRLEERYRDSDQDGFVAFLRQDGNLLDAGVAPVKYLQQAAS